MASGSGQVFRKTTIDEELGASPPSAAPTSTRKPERRGFRIRTELEDRGPVGAGGMAEIRKVFDRFLQRMVAVKILRPGLSATARERFVQEARITGQLDHPNIIPVHALAADRFTMKLVRGETLADRLEAYTEAPGNQELADLVGQLLKVCDALSFAHSRGVIHRDVKSENIMLGRFGEVYLADWGVALVMDSEETRRPAAVVGTPCFMSPEAASGALDRIDPRTDVFGLGGVLYEVLTLEPPHAGTDAEEVLRAARRCQVTPPHLTVAGADQPAVLCDIAMKALAADPEERFQTIDEMRAALDSFLQSGAWFARRRAAAGQEIVREGEPGQEAYIVESGHCEVYRVRAGERIVLRSVGPGDIFGELALFAAEERTATVQALEEVSLLVISSETLERQFPAGSWPRHFLDTLAGRFRQIERRRGPGR
ncbi:MAG: protein kinase [Myxococcales bacterium]|nr:protein kinase [Myxococcales bacterium]